MNWELGAVKYTWNSLHTWGTKPLRIQFPLVGGILKMELNSSFPIETFDKTHVVYCSEAVPVSSAAYFDLKSILSVNKLPDNTRTLSRRGCYFV